MFVYGFPIIMLELDDNEKLQIKNMVEKMMRWLIRELVKNAEILAYDDYIDEDTDTCNWDLRVFKQTKNLCMHLYNPELIDYDVREFWNNDTSIRDAVWDMLKEHLDRTLYNKVYDYLDSHNRPS